MQRELENTVRELDSTKASLVEKDRIIKQRDNLLESHALESRKMSDLLDKERVSHRNTKSQFDTFQRTHQHLTRTASTQDVRIAELETTRGQERRKLATLELQAREQLAERNQLLLLLWQKLSAICGKEWSNNNALIDRQVLPSLEVVATRLPGFSKNLMAAVKTVETIIGSFHVKIRAVERDLTREYQSLENNLEIRTKKLDRIETMVRNTVASQAGTSSHELQNRMIRMENKYRSLKMEYATLKAKDEARSRAPFQAATTNPETLIPADDPGSPSPMIPRGPLDRDRVRSSHGGRNTTMLSRTNTAPSGKELTLADEGGSGSGGSSNDKPWLYRLRDMEYKLKMEREGRNQDRQAARQRLEGLETENKDLRDRVRRGNVDE
jgi:hypothetical protein